MSLLKTLKWVIRYGSDRLSSLALESFSSVIVILVPIVLFAFGLLMIFNTTSAEVIDLSLPLSPYHSLVKQLAYGFICIYLILITRRLPTSLMVRSIPYLFYATLFLLMLVLIPKVGVSVNGSRRWLRIGPLSLQPSEMMKYLAPLWILIRLNGYKYSTWINFIKRIFMGFVPILLMVLQPNNGSALITLSACGVAIFIANPPLKYWLYPMLILGSITCAVALNTPYVQRRIHSFLHPELDPLGRGHQPRQAKIAAGAGGLWGRGTGKSLQKLSYLPEAQNDYIAAIFAEEQGFVGVLFLIVLYTTLLTAGFYLAFFAPEPLYGSLAITLTFVICIQAFLNLGVVSGLLPSTGLNLPFFSQGGSSLLANTCAICLLSKLNAAPSIA